MLATVLLVAAILVCGALGQTASHKRLNGRSQSATAVQAHSDPKLAPVGAFVDRSVDRSVSADMLELSRAAADGGSEEEEKLNDMRHRSRRSAVFASGPVPQRDGSALHPIAAVPASAGAAAVEVPGAPLAILDDTNPVSPSTLAFRAPGLSQSRWRHREQVKRIHSRKLQASLERQRGQAYVGALQGLSGQKNQNPAAVRRQGPPLRSSRPVTHSSGG